jgi:hypothetical protein
MSTPQRVVLGAWLAMIGLATVRALGSSKQLPQPSVYLGSGVLFTLLYGAAGVLGPLAATVAVGVDVAALVAPYLRGQTSGPLDTLAGFLDRLAPSGQPAQPAPGAAKP